MSLLLWQMNRIKQHKSKATNRHPIKHAHMRPPPGCVKPKTITLTNDLYFQRIKKSFTCISSYRWRLACCYAWCWSSGDFYCRSVTLRKNRCRQTLVTQRCHTVLPTTYQKLITTSILQHRYPCLASREVM